MCSSAFPVLKAPKISMSFKSITMYHQPASRAGWVIAQNITKLGEFFLCGTSCYNFERLRVTKNVLTNLRISAAIGSR